MDHAFVDLVVAGVKLREAGRPADYDREDPRCGRVQRAQMPHTARARQPPHPVYDVVGGPAAWLIDYDDSIHPPNLTVRQKVSLAGGAIV